MFSVAFNFCTNYIQILYLKILFLGQKSWQDYIFIWQLWLGIAYAAKNQTHIRVTVFRDVLSNKWKRILEFFALIIWFVFGTFIIVQGAQNCKHKSVLMVRNQQRWDYQWFMHMRQCQWAQALMNVRINPKTSLNY